MLPVVDCSFFSARHVHCCIHLKECSVWFHTRTHTHTQRFLTCGPLSMAGNTPFSLSLKHVSLMSARLVILPPWVPFKVLLHCSMLLETSCWLSWIWDNLLRACRGETHTHTHVFTVQSTSVTACVFFFLRSWGRQTITLLHKNSLIVENSRQSSAAPYAHVSCSAKCLVPAQKQEMEIKGSRRKLASRQRFCTAVLCLFDPLISWTACCVQASLEEP